MTCFGPGGQVTRNAVVTVGQVLGAGTPVLNIYANPSPVNRGANTTVSWNTQNVTSCFASGDWNGGKAINGSEVQSKEDEHSESGGGGGYGQVNMGRGGSDDEKIEFWNRMDLIKMSSSQKMFLFEDRKTTTLKLYELVNGQTVIEQGAEKVGVKDAIK